MRDVALARPPASSKRPSGVSNPDLRLHVGCRCDVLRTEGFVLTGLTSDKAVCTQDSLELHVENHRH